MTRPIELTFRESGSGSPLVILHGLFGSAANWGGHARTFAATHRVIVPDLRNHGASPHGDAMGYDAMAADVLALVDGLGLDRIDLLGHSLGGKISMQLALHHPERIARLVVADIAPRTYTGNQDEVIAALQAVDLPAVQRREDADAQLAAHIANPSLRAFLLTNLVRGESGFAWRINLPSIVASLPGIYGFPHSGGRRFDGPTLFLAGADSDYVRREDEAGILDRFPSARFERLAGAGHWLHADRPAEFREAVQRFLAGPGSAAA